MGDLEEVHWKWKDGYNMSEVIYYKVCKNILLYKSVYNFTAVFLVPVSLTLVKQLTFQFFWDNFLKYQHFPNYVEQYP